LPYPGSGFLCFRENYPARRVCSKENVSLAAMDFSHQHTRNLPIRLDLPEGCIEAEIKLPHGPMRLVDFAFTTLGLSSTVADMGARITANLGRKVSCSKGCGVCCRQLVPLSPPEAIMLVELVISMPKDIRTLIQNRFATAVRQLERSVLLEKLARLQEPSSLSDEDMQALTKEYFLQQIPCPFLENECCSIYEFRPSRCREYLVISPPKHCHDPYTQRIDRLPVSIRLSEALSRMWAEATQNPPQLIPLILALKWSAEHKSQRGIAADGHDMLKALLFYVTQIAENERREQA
jgi:Fe-S-cluster containining protein